MLKKEVDKKTWSIENKKKIQEKNVGPLKNERKTGGAIKKHVYVQQINLICEKNQLIFKKKGFILLCMGIIICAYILYSVVVAVGPTGVSVTVKGESISKTIYIMPVLDGKGIAFKTLD